MYVKASSRRNKSGQTVRYLQLAHNEWDPAAGRSRTKVLYSFGREDELDREAVKRLVAALSRLLDPAEALAATTPGDLSLTGSRPLGGTHALDGLWHRLGLDRVVRRQLEGRRLDPRIVWVADRGFSSALNRRTLMQGGGGYIIGEKLRTDSPEVQAALGRPGRYATIRDNMQVKEVRIVDHRRRPHRGPGHHQRRGQTWNRLRTELGRLHAVSYTGPAGAFRQSTDPTKPQRDIFTTLNIAPPKKIIDLTAGR